jgi:hypothetical protein
MPRFTENRKWTKVLTLQLALAIAGALVFGSVNRAEAGQAYVPEPGSSTGAAPSGSGGDPDVPTAGSLKLRPGMDRFPAMTEGGAGDVVSEPGIRSLWIIRLRFVALGMRAYLLRF